MQLKLRRGFALLESLLAMTLLVGGVLALLWSMQRANTQQRQQLHRAQAMRLADNMAQRMRAHPNALTDAYARTWQASAATPQHTCHTQACDNLAWVTEQQQQANDELKQLPRGDMAITPLAFDANPLGGPAWVITVAWQDPEEAFRTDGAWGEPPCPAAKSCWRLLFRSHSP